MLLPTPTVIWTSIVAVVAIAVVVISYVILKTTNDNLEASENALRNTQTRKIVYDTANNGFYFMYGFSESVTITNAESYSQRKIYRRIIGSSDDPVDMTSLITQTMLTSGDTVQEILETATGSTGFSANTVIYGILW